MKFKGIEVKGTFKVIEYINFFEVWQGGNEIYWESIKGEDYWGKCEYDENGNCNYYEDSDGDIVDERPKPKTQKVFRLWKYLEDEDLSSKDKVSDIFELGRSLFSSPRTYAQRLSSYLFLLQNGQHHFQALLCLGKIFLFLRVLVKRELQNVDILVYFL